MDVVTRCLLHAATVVCLFAVLVNGIDLEHYILKSNTLPGVRFRPPIGNGHVATNVLSDTIYMNGVFNGRDDASSRARIPSTISIDVNTRKFSQATREYTLNMYHGVFYQTIAIRDVADINITYFAHRQFPRIMASRVEVQRRNQAGDLHFNLTLNKGNASKDINATTVDSGNGVMYTHGLIVAPELDGGARPELHQYWMQMDSSLLLPSSDSFLVKTYISSFSTDPDDAKTAFDTAHALDQDELLRTHVEAWESLWSNGRVSVPGNKTLGQNINAAMYHILCSLPDHDDAIIPFFGLSPGGLSRGGLLHTEKVGGGGNDYAGHVFWDMDTWMMPPIMVFHPDMARRMIGARTRVMNTARQNAIEGGKEGIRFPWEQAATGIEATPKWAGNTSRYQIHITADVSYALRQYLYATGDTDLLEHGKGLEMAFEIARFWKSRVTKKGNEIYDILGVMGPDEYHFNIDNSVYTNYNAKLSLTLPSYIASRFNIPMNKLMLEEIKTFEQIANKMHILFDEKLQYHPQYEGFDMNITIKQTDVVLLGYPLMMPMPPEIRRNDLILYEKITDPNGPDTGTWSMYTVGWLELGDKRRAEKSFNMMFRNINDPFKVFSENPVSVWNGGCVNFITGAGGLLQAVLFGYGGVRLQPDTMVINPTVFPHPGTSAPDSPAWSIHGLEYKGFAFDIEVFEKKIVITMTKESQGRKVEISFADQRVRLNRGEAYNFQPQPATLTVADEMHQPVTCPPSNNQSPISGAPSLKNTRTIFINLCFSGMVLLLLNLFI